MSRILDKTFDELTVGDAVKIASTVMTVKFVTDVVMTATLRVMNPHIRRWTENVNEKIRKKAENAETKRKFRDMTDKL